MKLIQIIKEYRRDVTGQALGDRLIQRLAKESDVEGLDDELRLVMMAYKPQFFGPRKYALRIGGELITPSPDDAKEYLQKYKQHIIDKVLQYIENRDPTRNKEYTQWLARQWVADNAELEDLNRQNMLGKFDVLKRKNLLKPEQRDINRFKTYNDFESTIAPYELPDEQKQEVDKGRAEEAYQDSDVRVVIPHNETAACYYGQGTRWCTAGREHNQFNRYNNQGSMFILLPKHPVHAGEKYQLHFPTGQFMDERDDPVDVSWLLEKRFPNLLEWFFEQYPNQITTVLNFISDDEVDQIIDSIATDTFKFIKTKLDRTNINDADKETILDAVRQIGSIGAQELIHQMADTIESSSIMKIPSFISDSFQVYTEDSDIPMELDPVLGNIIGFIYNIKMVRDEDGKWFTQPPRQ